MQQVAQPRLGKCMPLWAAGSGQWPSIPWLVLLCSAELVCGGAAGHVTLHREAGRGQVPWPWGSVQSLSDGQMELRLPVTHLYTVIGVTYTSGLPLFLHLPPKHSLRAAFGFPSLRLSSEQKHGVLSAHAPHPPPHTPQLPASSRASRPCYAAETQALGLLASAMLACPVCSSR